MSHGSVRPLANRAPGHVGCEDAVVNRTDRLYALVEELRAAAPRALTARRLAERFEVSVRTIERDLSALQQAGVPIWATPGRGGGYSLDPTMTLPPLNFTGTEALAVAMALLRSGPLPFAADARRAFQKLAGAMSERALVEARELADRVRLLMPEAEAGALPPALEEAVRDRLVLALEYADAADNVTTRVVEPVGLVGNERHWYLVAWCRLRGDARSFRVDRIRELRLTGEAAPEHSLEVMGTHLPEASFPIPLAE